MWGAHVWLLCSMLHIKIILGWFQFDSFLGYWLWINWKGIKHLKLQEMLEEVNLWGYLWSGFLLQTVCRINEFWEKKSFLSRYVVCGILALPGSRMLTTGQIFTCIDTCASSDEVQNIWKEHNLNLLGAIKVEFENYYWNQRQGKQNFIFLWRMCVSGWGIGDGGMASLPCFLLPLPLHVYVLGI